MTWSPLAPSAKAQKTLAAITVSSAAGIGLHSPKLTLSFRVALLPGIDWLRPGTGVQVMVGHGEHAGMLRITPHGLHPLLKVALCKPAGAMVALKLPMPPGMTAAKRATVAIEHDFQDGWIEVTLPDWMPPAEPAGVVLAKQAAETARRKAGL